MARPARGREVLAGIPSRRRTQKLQALLQGPLGSPGQHLDLPPGGPAHGPDGNPPARARRLDRRARAPRIDVTAPARAPRRPRPATAPASVPESYALHACRAPDHGQRRPRLASATAPRPPDPRAVAASDVPGGRRRTAVGADTRQIASSPGCDAARERPVARSFALAPPTERHASSACERGSDSDYVRNRTYGRLED